MKTKSQSSKTLKALQVITLTLILQSLTTSARSAVSMKDAAFLTTARDIALKTAEGPPIEFKRYYSSRSHYLGWFGFGWCTDFEKTIDFLENHKIRLEDCKMTRPEELAPKDYTKLSDRIRITTNNDTSEFDLSGRLIKITSQELTATIKYKNSTTAEISSSLKLTFDPQTKFVTSIATDKQKIEYEYDGDNLTAVKDGKISAFNYHYDNYKNLERIDYQDQTFETIAYDSVRDRVKLFRDKKGCIEKYSFEKSPEKVAVSVLPRSTSSFTGGFSKVERLCQGRLVAHALFKVGPTRITQVIERLPSNENKSQGDLQ